jgi:hypothetical protein
VCADEKPSIQARARKHPSSAAPGGDGQLVEHEYERKGALCYLAAWDVRRARLFDRCAPTDGIVPFDALVEQFMTQEPYSKAQRVFVIVEYADTIVMPTRVRKSSHRGMLAGRVGERRPAARHVLARLAWFPPAATSNRACGSPAHGSPTFFTAGIQRPRRHGRLGRGATMVPPRLISPIRSGD